MLRFPPPRKAVMPSKGGHMRGCLVLMETLLAHGVERKGERINDHHLTLAEKTAIREGT